MIDLGLLFVLFGVCFVDMCCLWFIVNTLRWLLLLQGVGFGFGFLGLVIVLLMFCVSVLFVGFLGFVVCAVVVCFTLLV